MRIQMTKHAIDKAYRNHKKEKGGAWGMPKRATMKPVLQMSTNTAGIARNQAADESE
jgi:hypothetical protein